MRILPIQEIATYLESAPRRAGPCEQILLANDREAARQWSIGVEKRRIPCRRCHSSRGSHSSRFAHCPDQSVPGTFTLASTAFRSSSRVSCCLRKQQKHLPYVGSAKTLRNGPTHTSPPDWEDPPPARWPGSHFRLQQRGVPVVTKRSQSRGAQRERRLSKWSRHRTDWAVQWRKSVSKQSALSILPPSRHPIGPPLPQCKHLQ